MALKKGNWIPREGGPDLQTIRRLFGNNLMWVAAALLVLVILLLVSIRIGRVEGT